jgi:hypothetical protein
MTSLRPDNTGAWNFINYFREKHPSAVSFPEFFKQQEGYLALGAGKLYHTTNPPYSARFVGRRVCVFVAFLFSFLFLQVVLLTHTRPIGSNHSCASFSRAPTL